MRLIMFDIDGTLTDTNVIDAQCFIQALADEFGFSEINADWSTYQHTTDSGILEELFRKRLARPPAEEEIKRFQVRFTDLLSAAGEEDPHAFKPIAGAHDMMRMLVNDPQLAVSLASGGWQRSARLKLRLAGLASDDLPAAFADDAQAREQIMKCSLERACCHYRQQSFTTIIYIGDGVWDALASKNLDFKFIGIGAGKQAAALEAVAAARVFADYSDAESFRTTIDEMCQSD